MPVYPGARTLMLFCVIATVSARGAQGPTQSLAGKQECAAVVARVRSVEDYPIAKSLHGFFGVAGFEMKGAFVDMQVARGKDIILGDAMFGATKEKIDQLTNRGVLQALEWSLGKRAIFAIRSSEAKKDTPLQTAPLTAEINELSEDQMESVLKAALKSYIARVEAGANVKALSPPTPGGGLRDALAEYHRFLAARMKDEMLQDPKRTVDRRKLDDMTEAGVAEAYKRFWEVAGCKGGK